MRIRWMTLCALFAAMTAVCAQIMIPLGTVPVNLALLPLLVCAAMTNVRCAVATAAAYIGMGAAGLPVFAGMTGGVGVLAGPTGGYLVGYVLCVGLAAWLIGKGARPHLAMGAGTAVCYAAGTLWMAFSTGMSLPEALLTGVVPFLAGDILKIFVACYLAKRLYIVVRA